MDPLRLVRPDLADLQEYAAVQPLEMLAAELDLPVRDLVKLDANENAWGTHPEVRAAAAGAPYHIYPDPAQTALRRSIAEYCQVTPDQVVCGQGADDLIDLIFRLFAPQAVVDNVPSFGMYRFLAAVNGARVVEVERLERFNLDLDGNERAVSEGATVIFVTSPNNPTGNSAAGEELERLLALDAVVVVDEAYVEFGSGSAVPLLARFPNLVILRTFSKWAGLAGLRVGYALATPEITTHLLSIKQPYNVSVAAEAAARAVIEYRAEILETVRGIVSERERMSARVAELGWLEPHPSEANFVLFAVKGRRAAEVAAGLRRRGVFVRYYERPLLKDFIRISAGRPRDTDRLLDALREVGGP